MHLYSPLLFISKIIALLFSDFNTTPIEEFSFSDGSILNEVFKIKSETYESLASILKVLLLLFRLNNKSPLSSIK